MEANQKYHCKQGGGRGWHDIYEHFRTGVCSLLTPLSISSVTRCTPRCCGRRWTLRWSQAPGPTMRPPPCCAPCAELLPCPEPLLWLAEQAIPRPADTNIISNFSLLLQRQFWFPSCPIPLFPQKVKSQRKNRKREVPLLSSSRFWKFAKPTAHLGLGSWHVTRDTRGRCDHVTPPGPASRIQSGLASQPGMRLLQWRIKRLFSQKIIDIIHYQLWAFALKTTIEHK